MEKLNQIVSHPTEPAPRPVRRRVGITVVILVAALFGWALTKHAASGGLADSEVDEGLDVLVLAVGGDAAQFRVAESHFIDAASVSVMDPYPAFLIRTGRRLAGPRSDEDPQDRIAAAVVDGDLERARARVDELRVSSEGAARLWDRLLGELESRLH